MARERIANEAEGEVEIVLGEKTWVMRPSFRALALTETMISYNTIAEFGAAMLNMGSVKAADLVACIYCGIAAAYPEDHEIPTQDEIGEDIMKVGFFSVLEPMTEYLGTILSFWKDTTAKKKVGLSAQASTARKPPARKTKTKAKSRSSRSTEKPRSVGSNGAQPTSG